MTEPPRPRIFLDGYNLALEQGTGVATYARNLSYALGRLGYGTGVLYGTRAAASAEGLLREIGFFDEKGPALGALQLALRRGKGLLRALGGETAWPVPVTGAVVQDGLAERLPHFDELWNAQDLFQQAAVNFRLLGGRLKARVAPAPALMHWTYPLPLRLPGALNLYTLHDLVPLRLPYTTLDNKARYWRLVRMLARRADHVVTVSEASRRDIINLLGCAPERVTNTYQAVEVPAALRDLPAEMAAAEVRGSLGLEPDGYWLFFGAIEPKKNVARLVQAYLASGVEAPLVIAGKRAWKSDEELRLLDDLLRRGREAGPGGRPRVVMLDYVPQRLLVGLIRGARAVLFPSLYEGFGLPALEAMQLGTPVITSNTAALPEVVGDAALTVDPYDISALVRAIQAVEHDPALRARLAAVGPERAALFSPERYAARLARLYTGLGVPPPAG